MARSGSGNLFDYLLSDLVFDLFIMGVGRGIVKFFGGNADDSFLMWILALILGGLFWVLFSLGIYYLLIWVL